MGFSKGPTARGEATSPAGLVRSLVAALGGPAVTNPRNFEPFPSVARLTDNGREGQVCRRHGGRGLCWGAWGGAPPAPPARGPRRIPRKARPDRTAPTPPARAPPR